ncbi:hypothetical protein A7C99_3453 [Trichophyton rubrum]|uniref:Uncharacterized protein n=1 Tax=Trichophyton rubrum TaxID=5551 RepID=A0A178EY93_TRIRU|nr:hypothetical protein H107_01833 [Trichophyton rubrum CBS 202.88]OAL64974.1 hypothetical protein A7C99_3453 [Trichophyton rubrum]
MDRKMSCEQWSVLYSCGCEVTLRRDSPDCDGTCGDDDTLVFLPDENSLDVCGDCSCRPAYMSPPKSSSEEEDDDEEQEEAEAGDEDKDENEDGEDEDDDEDEE